MSCTVEVYSLVVQAPPMDYTILHTNIGYTHYDTAGGLWALLKRLEWRWYHAGERARKGFDRWLRDGPPACVRARGQK